MVQARIFALITLALSMIAAPAFAQPTEVPATPPAATPPAATPAPADSTTEVEKLAQQAGQAYKVKDYERAVSLYLEAYALEPAAAVLYNVAIIYDKKLKDPQLATTFYRRYIGAPDADPEVVKRATFRLGELKAKEKQRKAAEVARLKAKPPVVVKPKPKKTSTRKVVGWSIAGAGVMALGVGVFAGLQSATTHDEFKKSTDLKEKLDLRDHGHTQTLVADLSMGLGAALAITGVILALTAPENPATTRLQLTPTIDGAGATVWLGGSL